MSKDGYRVGIFMPRLRVMARELAVSEEELASELGRLITRSARVGPSRFTRGGRRVSVFSPSRRPSRRLLARSLAQAPSAPPPRRPFGPPPRRYWPYWPGGLWPDYAILRVEPSVVEEPLEPFTPPTIDVVGGAADEPAPSDGDAGAGDEPVDGSDEGLDLLWRLL